MGELWLPHAERVSGVQPTGSMAGGPPRALWHYTADKLHEDHTRAATFEGTRGYLVSKRFEPHLMIDPFGGRTAQFLPFNQFASAAVHRGSPETNRMGTVCLQVEWFFTPGMVYKGKRYAKLSDTPMDGLDLFLEACDSWGIPRLYRGGRHRDPKVWETQAGHYGHIDVPENYHVDPDPMDWDKVLASPPHLTISSQNGYYAVLQWTATHGATAYYFYDNGVSTRHTAGRHETGPARSHGRHVYRVLAVGPNGMREWSNTAVVDFPV